MRPGPRRLWASGARRSARGLRWGVRRPGSPTSGLAGARERLVATPRGSIGPERARPLLVTIWHLAEGLIGHEHARRLLVTSQRSRFAGSPRRLRIGPHRCDEPAARRPRSRRRAPAVGSKTRLPP